MEDVKESKEPVRAPKPKAKRRYKLSHDEKEMRKRLGKEFNGKQVSTTWRGPNPCNH
jgi:hypothetical protein